jgi:tyrosinase
MWLSSDEHFTSLRGTHPAVRLHNFATAGYLSPPSAAALRLAARHRRDIMGGSLSIARSISRREVLAGTAALATAASLPLRGAAAAPARHRRWNVSDPDCPPRMLDSYKKAIRAMLALPPSDPRNWYRYTLIHTLDCPHGNWWFLPWHRGYVAWFERICRALSGDPDFALPYWDWTTEPRVPKAMFDDVLDPGNDAFLAAAGAFKAAYKDAVAKAGYWDATRSPDLTVEPSPQYAQLLARSIRTPEDLWFDIIEDPMGPMFFDRPNARGLSAEQPDLIIPTAPPEKQSVLIAVSAATIRDALAPRDFISFAGPKTVAHSYSPGFGVLESQPHNLVHNCVGGVYSGVGGFMQAFMSPADPIFYLHHANIDRLWDVWTRKQRARNYPILPEGYPAAPGEAPARDSDYPAWAREPFLFFVDDQGRPVERNLAGAYGEIGDFDYDYAPGSGEEVVAVPPQTPETAAAPRRSFAATLARTRVGEDEAASGSVVVPLALVRQQTEPEQPKLFASVAVNVPPQRHDNFEVFIGSGDGAAPRFVATLLMFGHHVMPGPVSFLVPLSAALAKLQENRTFASDPKLEIEIVPRPKRLGRMPMTAQIGGASEVTAISIEQL